MFVAEPVCAFLPRQRCQRDALRAQRTSAGVAELARARLHHRLELRGLGDGVHQAPVDGALAAHAFDAGAEDIGQVVADLALVGHARQTARAGQHAQQRHLGQRHGRRTVIDQHDLVAGQRQFIAAARAGAVDGREEFQAFVPG
ncbi:hypothetical protein D3C78_1547840 [compost metagenome]